MRLYCLYTIHILCNRKAFAQTHRTCMKETSQSASARNKLTSPPNVPAKPPKTRPLRTSSSHQTLKRNTYIYIQEKRYQSVQRTARNNRKCIYAKRKIYIFVICGLSLEWSWGGRGAVATIRMHISNSVYNKHSAPPPPHVKRLNIYIRMI